jgi:lipopolysaccharide export LptBFGC system permease protein LptF
MLYYYQFDIAGLFVLLLASVTLCVRKGSLFRHAYYALWMMAMAFVYTLSDGVSAYLIGLANPSYYVLTYVVLLFYFMSLLLFPYCSTVYSGAVR